MKALMFGWEFPPFISGGLGTACYGITKGLLENDVDVTFVLPTKKGKGITGPLKVIGADEVPLVSDIEEIERRLKIINTEFAAPLTPYVTSLINNEHESTGASIKNMLGMHGGILNFTGNYGENLLSEVMSYSLVGETLGLFEDFDIIHAHDWLTFPAGVRAKRISGKPLIAHVHATEIDRNGGCANEDVFNIEKYGMENADKIVAVSFYTKNIIVNHYGIDTDKIEVVHNAVNKKKQIERYKITRNLDEKIVLFLGRVTMQKGPEYFIEAANLVLKDIDNVRFVMAGSGDMLPHMISRMAELKIADRFHFTGFLRGVEVEKMYAMSDLYVMPSVSEPFGLTPFEALLYDVPIIISKQSGASEILRHAITLDFWDVEKLANSIVAILGNGKVGKEIVRECQEEIQNLEWHNAGERLKDIYSSISVN
ncbi:MAG: glycosyltransferase family 4 protein [Spirochaetota bacterium]|nr:glycosyltransferase family 4 protein [Spirochaetota bacterium]